MRNRIITFFIQIVLSHSFPPSSPPDILVLTTIATLAKIISQFETAASAKIKQKEQHNDSGCDFAHQNPIYKTQQKKKENMNNEEKNFYFCCCCCFEIFFDFFASLARSSCSLFIALFFLTKLSR